MEFAQKDAAYLSLRTATGAPGSAVICVGVHAHQLHLHHNHRILRISRLAPELRLQRENASDNTTIWLHSRGYAKMNMQLRFVLSPTMFFSMRNTSQL